MSSLSLLALLATPLALQPLPQPLLQDGGDGQEWKTGSPDLVSAGALALGPDGVLFVGDHQGAAIYAFRVERAEAAAADAAVSAGGLDVDDLGAKLAALVGTSAEEIVIHDLAVDGESATAFLSLTRQGASGAQPVLARVRGPEAIEILDLEKLPYVRVALENAPPPDDGGRRSKRTQSITDLAFHDGVLYVAGLSNEEFASKLRGLAYPFEEAGQGTSVEIYHANHGAWETRSPVRALVPIDVGGAPYLLCGYTCTPLVTVPVERIAGIDKIVGTTVAELGNRNTPLDMVVYEKGGEGFVLIANTSRGVMKVSTAGLEGAEGLTERTERGGTAGLPFETVEALADVTQLAALDGTRAVVLVEKDGSARLTTVELP